MPIAAGDELPTIALEIQEKCFPGVQSSHIADIPPYLLALVGTWGQFSNVEQHVVDELNGQADWFAVAHPQEEISTFSHPHLSTVRQTFSAFHLSVELLFFVRLLKLDAFIRLIISLVVSALGEESRRSFEVFVLLGREHFTVMEFLSFLLVSGL